VDGKSTVKRRRTLGIRNPLQDDFIAIMLEGQYSVADAAIEAGVPPSTATKWMRIGSPIRQEIERRRDLLGKVEQAYTRVIDDARSTPWARAEAATGLMKLLELTPEDKTERQKRCDERRMRLYELWDAKDASENDGEPGTDESACDDPIAAP